MKEKVIARYQHSKSFNAPSPVTQSQLFIIEIRERENGQKVRYNIYRDSTELLETDYDVSLSSYDIHVASKVWIKLPIVRRWAAADGGWKGYVEFDGSKFSYVRPSGYTTPIAYDLDDAEEYVRRGYWKEITTTPTTKESTTMKGLVTEPLTIEQRKALAALAQSVGLTGDANNANDGYYPRFLLRNSGFYGSDFSFMNKNKPSDDYQVVSLSDMAAAIAKRIVPITTTVQLKSGLTASRTQGNDFIKLSCGDQITIEAATKAYEQLIRDFK